MAWKNTINREGGHGRCLAQMVGSVRDNLVAGGGGNLALNTDEFWSDAEIIRNINYAYNELWKIAKNLRTDLFTEVMGSDESFFVRNVIDGFQTTFDPSSFKITQNIQYYTLPTELAELKNIRGLDSEHQGVRFRHKDFGSEEFKTAFYKEAGTGSGEYLFDVIGRRSLVIAPKPQETFDIEIVYTRRLRRLFNYSDGTVNVDEFGQTVFNGVGTNWTQAPQPELGMLFFTGTVVDVNKDYPAVEAYSTATSLILHSTYRQPTVENSPYTLSSVPALEDCDELLVAYATQLGFRKGSSPNLRKAKSWLGEYERLIPAFKNGLGSRVESGPEFVEPYLEDA